MKEFEYKELVGESFEDMSMEDMIMSQGSGEVAPHTTMPCTISLSITFSIATSSAC